MKLAVFRLGLHQLGSQPTFYLPRWTAHPCILYQVRDVRGVVWCSVDYSQLYACAFDALKAGTLALVSGPSDSQHLLGVNLEGNTWELRTTEGTASDDITAQTCLQLVFHYLRLHYALCVGCRI